MKSCGNRSGMPSGEVLGNTSRVPVVSQPPGLLVQAGGWVKERGTGDSLLGLGAVAAAALDKVHFHFHFNGGNGGHHCHSGRIS